jgi:hypothetical protein
MSTLKELLTQVADEARLYDGTDRAVRALRRRRAAVRFAPVAAALVVATGVAATTLAVGRGTESGPSTVAAGLPARLSPANSPPDLPTDRGVGTATLGYVLRAHRDNADEFRLVTSDGRQYAVPRADWLVGISPDGRWLLWSEPSRRVVMRDLTGTGRYEFGPDTANGFVVAAWSPDSRRLALQILHNAASDVEDRVTLMVDLDPVAQRTVPLDRGHSVCAVRNSGDMILCPPGDAPWTKLRLVDSVTGRISREVDLDGIGPAFGRIALRPDDTTVVIPTPGAIPTELVAIDLGTGRVTARYPLPTPTPQHISKDPSGAEEYGAADWRQLAAAPVEGVLLVHISPRADDPMSGRAVAVEMIAPETGALTVVTRVSGDIAWILLRGEGN